jgi:hypothetical protein
MVNMSLFPILNRDDVPFDESRLTNSQGWEGLETCHHPRDLLIKPCLQALWAKKYPSTLIVIF